MKKSCISFIIGLLSFANSYAQNTFPANGNVGIGTTNPVANLDVYSTANTQTVPLISIRSNFHVAGNYGMIQFGDYTQTTAYQKGALIYESVGGSARGKFHIALENTDGGGSVSLTDAKLTVLSNGNVGIGTTSPDAKLTVNGTIHSSEVKVDTSIPVPDYVFEKSYKLPSLTELNKYITRNKHLPEIPSARVMEKEGVNLGEMNLKLLKKVEELTLYLIEKDNEQKAQRKILSEQQRLLKQQSLKLRHLLQRLKL